MQCFIKKIIKIKSIKSRRLKHKLQTLLIELSLKIKFIFTPIQNNNGMSFGKYLSMRKSLKIYEPDF